MDHEPDEESAEPSVETPEKSIEKREQVENGESSRETLNKASRKELIEIKTHIAHLKKGIEDEQARMHQIEQVLGLPTEEPTPSLLNDLKDLAHAIFSEQEVQEKVIENNDAKPELEKKVDEFENMLFDHLLEMAKTIPEKDLEHMIEFGMTASKKRLSLPIIGDVTPTVAKLIAQALHAGKGSFQMELLEASGAIEDVKRALKEKALNVVTESILGPVEAMELPDPVEVNPEEGLVDRLLEQFPSAQGDIGKAALGALFEPLANTLGDKVHEFAKDIDPNADASKKQKE